MKPDNDRDASRSPHRRGGFVVNEYAKWADESHAAWMRRVDMFVAEEVMGWVYMCFSTKPADEVDETMWAWTLPIGDQAFVAPWNWSPSTQIADAWLVVEKLGKLTGKDVLVEHCADGERLCTLGWHYRGIWMKDIQEKADTAPLAICLAALEAMK